MALDLHRLRKSYRNFRICCVFTIIICLLVGPLLILAGIVTCVVDVDRTAQNVALGLMGAGVGLAYCGCAIARTRNNDNSSSDADSGDTQRVTSRRSPTTNQPRTQNPPQPLYPPQSLYPPQQQNQCVLPYPLQPPSYEEAAGISQPSIIRFNY